GVVRDPVGVPDVAGHAVPVPALAGSRVAAGHRAGGTCGAAAQHLVRLRDGPVVPGRTGAYARGGLVPVFIAAHRARADGRVACAGGVPGAVAGTAACTARQAVRAGSIAGAGAAA